MERREREGQSAQPVRGPQERNLRKSTKKTVIGDYLSGTKSKVHEQSKIVSLQLVDFFQKRKKVTMRKTITRATVATTIMIQSFLFRLLLEGRRK